LRHGKGRFQYNDGGVYDGEWKFGAMDGFGKLFYPSEKLAYEGYWVNNTFNGEGKIYNEIPVEFEGLFNYRNFDNLQEHWEHYEGSFVEDFKEGMGTLFLVNGEKYVG